MFKKLNWTQEELDELGPSLRSAVEAPEKQKKERYWENGKIRIRLKNVPKRKCQKCSFLFYPKMPSQRFCQDSCRIRYNQKLHAKKEKRERDERINKLGF